MTLGVTVGMWSLDGKALYFFPLLLAKDAVRQGTRLVVEGRPDVLVRFSQRGMNTAGACFQLP